jgi:hypothetical protein
MAVEFAVYAFGLMTPVRAAGVADGALIEQRTCAGDGTCRVGVGPGQRILASWRWRSLAFGQMAEAPLGEADGRFEVDSHIGGDRVGPTP